MIFDDSAIRNHIEDVMNSNVIQVPKGKKIAFVVDADFSRDGRISGAFVARVGDYWQVGTLVDWSHDAGAKAGFRVMWSK